MKSVLKRNSNRFFAVIILLTGIIIPVSCEYAFDPLQENDKYAFSVNGVIDLSADTQWVRIMPIRNTLFYEAQESGANVTLETGSSSVTLQDSLFKFYPSPDEDTYVHNFFSSDSVIEGADYTLSVLAENGERAFADFTIPADFPTPIVDFREETNSARVHLSGIEKLVVCEVTYYFRVIDDQNVAVYTPGLVRNQFEAGAVDRYRTGNFTINISDFEYFVREFGVSANRVTLLSAEIVIVSGNDSWPVNEGLDDDEYVLSEEAYNVENGLGTVSGVVSKRVPFESCYDGDNQLVACPELSAVNWNERKFQE